MAKKSSNSKAVKKAVPVKKVKKKAAKHIRPKTKEKSVVVEKFVKVERIENSWRMEVHAMSLVDMLHVMEQMMCNINEEYIRKMNMV